MGTIDFNDNLENARQDWIIDEVSKMNLRYPVAELAVKLDYGKGTVSSYLTKRTKMSLAFMKKFCEQFEYDFEAVNHMIIDKLKRNITGTETKTIPLGGKTPPYKNGDESANPDVPLQPANNQLLIGSEVGEITSGNEEKNVNSMFTSNVPTMTESQLSLQLALQLAQNEAKLLNNEATLLAIVDRLTDPSLRLNRKESKQTVK